MESKEIIKTLKELEYSNSDDHLFSRNYYDQKVCIDIKNKLFYVVVGWIRNQEQLDYIQIALNNVKRDFNILFGGNNVLNKNN